MARQLLDRTGCVDDNWSVVEGGSELSLETLPPGAVICPTAFWLAHREALIARAHPVGVWLNADEEPDAVADDLAERPLVAIRFPTFNDGRALSLAVLLRTRYGYQGELRAIGAVHEDLMHYMRRCGFDTFLLRDGGNVDVACRSLNAMSEYYQGSVIDPRPRFRRRDTAARGRAVSG
jgi:uncharacterized protein (DUF934 family)